MPSNFEDRLNKRFTTPPANNLPNLRAYLAQLETARDTLKTELARVERLIAQTKKDIRKEKNR